MTAGRDLTDREVDTWIRPLLRPDAKAVLSSLTIVCAGHTRDNELQGPQGELPALPDHRPCRGSER